MATQPPGHSFGLLFLKRLSDRFEEKAEVLMAEGVSERVAWTNPDEHQVFVPDQARWGTLQKQTPHIGETLTAASAALEEQNEGIRRPPDQHRLHGRVQVGLRPRERTRGHDQALR